MSNVNIAERSPINTHAIGSPPPTGHTSVAKGLLSVRETQALFCEPVDIRCLELHACAIASRLAVTEIIEEDEDDVGLRTSRLGGKQPEQRCQQKEEDEFHAMMVSSFLATFFCH